MKGSLVQLGTVLSVAAVAGASAVAVTTATNADESSASPAQRAQNFTVVADLTENVDVDVKPHGPSVGDELVFAGSISSRTGTERGRVDAVCTTTSNPGKSDEQRRQCQITVTFADRRGAELQMQGVGRVEAEDTVFSITGGSGRYQGATGQATLNYVSPELVLIDFSVIS